MESIISLVISLAIAIFLYIDAPKYHKRPWLWAILGFIFGPFALGIYFIKTGRKVIGWILTIVVGLAYIAFLVLVVLAAVLFSQGFSM